MVSCTKQILLGVDQSMLFRDDFRAFPGGHRFAIKRSDRFIQTCQKPNILMAVALIMIFLVSLTWPDNTNADMTKTVTPRVSVSQTYDDNIDLTPTNEISDWITLVSPGVSLELESPQTLLNFDYEAGFSFYRDDSSRDATRHQVNLTWDQELREHLTFNLDNFFIRSEDPVVVRDGVIEDIRTSRDPEYRNTAEASLSYAFGTEDQVTVGYINRYVEDRSTANDDSLGQRMFGRLDKWFGLEYGIAVTSHFERGDFEQTDDFDQYAAGFQFNYRPISSRIWYVRYDFLDHNYDELVPGTQGDDFQVHQGVVGVDVGFGPNTNLHLEGGYYLQEYKEGEDYDGPAYEGRLVTSTQRTTFTIEGSGGHDQDYYSSTNFGPAEFHDISSRFDYQVLEHLGLFLSARYRWEEFRERNDSLDKTYGARVGLSYSFWQWLQLNLEAGHLKRDSDDPTREFDDNRVMLRVTWAYPHQF